MHLQTVQQTNIFFYSSISSSIAYIIKQGSRVRLIWAHMRLEFGVVQPNILFGRTGATENVSGIIIIIYFYYRAVYS